MSRGGNDERAALGQEVEELGHAARTDAGRRELEHHRFGRDDADGIEPAGRRRRLHPGSVCASAPGDTVAATWTSTATWPSTSRSGNVSPCWRDKLAIRSTSRRSELDELLALYQRTATNLSYVRTTVDDPALVGRLTRLVASAHGTIYGQPIRGRRSVRRFFTEAFPGALWHQRWFVVVATALTVVPALALGLWISHSPRAYEATAPAAVREAYVQNDFETYYSSEPAVQFASEVFTNNVRVAAFAFAAGILLCGLTAWILVQNGLNLGLAAGLFAVAGQEPRFWGLIIPHGLIELSAVIVAGAAGLRLGWTVIDPGDRTRGAALAEEGRRAGLVLMGVGADARRRRHDRRLRDRSRHADGGSRRARRRGGRRVLDLHRHAGSRARPRQR